MDLKAEAANWLGTRKPDSSYQNPFNLLKARVQILTLGRKEKYVKGRSLERDKDAISLQQWSHFYQRHGGNDPMPEHRGQNAANAVFNGASLNPA